MREIKLALGDRTYKIIIGENALRAYSPKMDSIFGPSPVLIVTNSLIDRLYGKMVRKTFASGARRVRTLIVPDSERAKSFAVYSKIIAGLLGLGGRAKPVIVALGGGVVGDVAGFAAATFRRGIPYVQVPTTLLAQVDSSIGGKVAVDLPEGKNLIGCFYQPACVVSDLVFLRSLPKKEIANGLAEIIKYGVIKDATLFNYLEANMAGILALDMTRLSFIIERCAAIKARVVESDERDEKDVRIILNFGHTFAHAIEAYYGYSQKYTHGEAVAIGMALAAKLGVKTGITPRGVCERLVKLIEAAGLPVELNNADTGGIMKFLSTDKKFVNGKSRFIVPEKIGKVRIIENVPEKLISALLKRGGALW